MKKDEAIVLADAALNHWSTGNSIEKDIREWVREDPDGWGEHSEFLWEHREYIDILSERLAEVIADAILREL